MRRAVGGILGVLLFSGSSLLVASPANAAMDSNCGLAAGTPRTDGVTVYVTATVTCSTYMDHTAVQVGAKVSKQDGLIWRDKTSYGYRYSSGATSLSVTKSWTCNGSGTDDYRTGAMGKTSDNGETRFYGSEKRLTC